MACSFFHLLELTLNCFYFYSFSLWGTWTRLCSPSEIRQGHDAFWLVIDGKFTPGVSHPGQTSALNVFLGARTGCHVRQTDGRNCGLFTFQPSWAGLVFLGASAFTFKVGIITVSAADLWTEIFIWKDFAASACCRLVAARLLGAATVSAFCLIRGLCSGLMRWD